MISRRMYNIIGGLGFLLGVLFLVQGCTQKKTYTVGNPGDQTASLIFPNFIQIRYFDGDSVENLFTRIIYEGKKELVFPAGTHTIELRYKDIWDIDDNDHENVMSAYITLQFDARAGNAYEIVVNAPKDRQSAHALASHFAAEIMDAKTKKKVSHPVPARE